MRLLVPSCFALAVVARLAGAAEFPAPHSSSRRQANRDRRCCGRLLLGRRSLKPA
jgi:hypothetical protein